LRHTASPAMNANDSKPARAIAMVCGACKTVSITERRLQPGTKAGIALFTIGSKHECEMCGGETTTANGKTVDSMQHNCIICGKDAASCCSASTAPEKG